MPLGPIELGGRRAFVLGFDPEAAGLPSLVSGPVVVVTPDGTVSRDLEDRLEPSVRGIPFSEARVDEDAVAVVHTLWTARVSPLLAAIRAGARTFQLVDAPGSSFTSNARGAVAWAVRRAFARALLRVPLLGRAVEWLLGHRLDVPWPSATATLRVVGAASARHVEPLRAGAPGRVVHWLPELGPRADDAVALLEHLVPPTRARGLAVEVLIPGPPDAYDVRVRRLQRLGASCRFLPLRPWRLRDERPRLPGLASALRRDVERHVHAASLLPLLEDLLAREAPLVVHGWLEPSLASASVAGLAGALVGARVILHAPAGTLLSGVADLAGLCLRRLAASDPEVAIIATDPRAARALVAGAELPEGRVVVAPHAVALDAPLAAAEREARRRLLQVGAGAFLLVALGDLDAVAASFLLDVVRRLADAGVAARTCHVGRSGAEARLLAREAGLDERLRLLGSAPDEREYLRLADAVLGLDARGRGRALEAPLVAPAGDEAFEGLAYAPGDSAAAAAHLLRLARDPELRRSLAERARSLSAERCAPAGFVAAVLGRYPGAPPGVRA